MARIEIVRDRGPEAKNGAAVWLGKDEEAYNEWVSGDSDMPEPTFIIEADEVDRFVIKWLRGPMGPPGTPGMDAE